MKMTGAEVIIKALEQEGVEVIFGYPGGAVIPLYDKLYDSSIKHVLVRHEQAAAHAADGYARATGRTGVVVATSGPGATNLVTGIANAWMDSIPMVVFTGQVALAAIGRDSFQEADITGITLPIVKHSYLVRDVNKLASTIKAAFHLAGRGGARAFFSPQQKKKKKGGGGFYSPPTRPPPGGGGAPPPPPRPPLSGGKKHPPY